MQTADAVLQSTPSSHSHAAEFNRYTKAESQSPPTLLSIFTGKFPKLCLTSKPPLDEDEDYKYFFNGSLSITAGETEKQSAEQDADNNPREEEDKNMNDSHSIQLQSAHSIGGNVSFSFRSSGQKSGSTVATKPHN